MYDIVIGWLGIEEDWVREFRLYLIWVVWKVVLWKWILKLWMKIMIWLLNFLFIWLIVLVSMLKVRVENLFLFRGL